MVQQQLYVTAARTNVVNVVIRYTKSLNIIETAAHLYNKYHENQNNNVNEKM